MNILDAKLEREISASKSIADLERTLLYLLDSGCSVFRDGDEEFLIFTRAAVDRIGSLKIEIYHKEHAPPHFHIRSEKVNCSFTIRDCNQLHGDIDSANLKLVTYWHRKAKRKLIEMWNQTRPTDCPVGVYTE